jgi:simple sugar transport system ATP-binding protein
MSLMENAFLSAATRKALTSLGFANWGKTRGYADEIIARFDVRTPNNQVAARALSGGNLQKFVVGREILQDPDVLVVNQPTWGVDASAAAAIRQALLDMVDAGKAVVVISQDLDELLEITDRFCALNEGRLSASVPTTELSVEKIGLMLGGAHDLETADV